MVRALAALKARRGKKRAPGRTPAAAAVEGVECQAGVDLGAAAVTAATSSLKQPAAEAREAASVVGLDLWLLLAALGILGLGTVMVYSASSIFAQVKLGDGLFFLRRHLLYGALGLCGLYLGWRIDYHHYRRWVYPVLLATVALLVALLVPGIGHRVDGAVRWFRFAGLSFQPSELAKLVLVVYLAHSLAQKSEDMRTFTIGYLPHLMVVGAVGVLILVEPDLGTTVIVFSVALLLLFIAGTKLSYIVLTVLAALPLAYYQIVGTPWRLRRLLAFLDPWAHRRDAGYQMAESLISVGSGGLYGLGLGSGKQKLFFLPAAHNDFIFAITGEELGFVGLLLVMALFLLLLYRGVRAAIGARDLFGTYLASGISAMFTLQALLHMAVVLGLLPTKGITLPLFSYGGTGLIFNLAGVGLLLNVAARNPLPVVVPARVPGRLANRRKATRVVVGGEA